MPVIKERDTGSVIFRCDGRLEDADTEGTFLENADLRGLDLLDVDLNNCELSGADLRGATLPPDVPVIPNIDAAILAAIEAGGKLNMLFWHICETTHCRAGWAVNLAGQKGKWLESRFGTSAAGALIYAASRPDLPVPDFFASPGTAMADIQKYATGGG